jgi:hypothetical protein
MIFFSLVVGAVAGLLAWAGGDNPFAAVLKGGAAVGGVLFLLLTIFNFTTFDGTAQRNGKVAR